MSPQAAMVRQPEYCAVRLLGMTRKRAAISSGER